MKKIKNLSESNFLKLFFAVITAAFLIAAVCMPDRNSMLSGFLQILSQPCRVTTNYFSVGGFSGTFLNMGSVALIMVTLFHVTKTKVNNVSTLAFFLTLGFCCKPLKACYCSRNLRSWSNHCFCGNYYCNLYKFR